MLTSLSFLHALGLVHADLKPENILVKSYSRCQVKASQGHPLGYQALQDQQCVSSAT